MDKLFSLEGRVALVTGGSRGIGRVVAGGFLRHGAKVCISARQADTCDRALASRAGDCVVGAAIVIDGGVSLSTSGRPS